MNIQSALVKAILGQHGAYKWTRQGFGFLRTKIENVGRIHIWDSRFRAPNMLSDIHTHPWPLCSTIISGELINQRFETVPAQEELPYIRSCLKTGEGGGLIGESSDVGLLALAPEFYKAGQTYNQLPQEIHRTIAVDGTVTLLVRPQGPPLEEALTFWPRGLLWQSAEPKEAADWEVSQAVGLALSRWSAA